MDSLCTEMVMEICSHMDKSSLRNLSICNKRFNEILKRDIWTSPRFHKNFPDILEFLKDYPIKTLHGDDFFYTSVHYLQKIKTLENFVVDATWLILSVVIFTDCIMIPPVFYTWTLRITNNNTNFYTHQSDHITDIFLHCWMVVIHQHSFTTTTLDTPLSSLLTISSSLQSSIQLTITHLQHLGINDSDAIDLILRRDLLFLEHFGLDFFHSVF